MFGKINAFTFHRRRREKRHAVFGGSRARTGVKHSETEMLQNVDEHELGWQR